jgi:protein-S-isoprenylcysteine O-methyltransferase Ste14
MKNLSLQELASTAGIFWMLSCVVWWLMELWLNRTCRAPQYREAWDKGTLQLLEKVNALSVASAIIISACTEFPLVKNFSLIVLGSVITIIGVCCRLAIVYSLGKNFTVDIHYFPDQTLLTTGWFRYIRHPSYIALYLCFIGLALALNNLFSLVIVLFPTAWALIIRVNQEEKILQENFTPQYQQYQKRTNAFLPFIY